VSVASSSCSLEGRRRNDEEIERARSSTLLHLSSFRRRASILHAQKQAAAGPAPAIPRKSHHPDSDLARAIALSLAEAQASSGTNRPGFVPTVSEPPIRGGRKEEGTDGEEDEDLRAAIEASLKEMRDAPSAPVGGEENGGEDSRRPVSFAFYSLVLLFGRLLSRGCFVSYSRADFFFVFFSSLVRISMSTRTSSLQGRRTRS